MKLSVFYNKANQITPHYAEDTITKGHRELDISGHGAEAMVFTDVYKVTGQVAELLDSYPFCDYQNITISPERKAITLFLRESGTSKKQVVENVEQISISAAGTSFLNIEVQTKEKDKQLILFIVDYFNGGMVRAKESD